MWQVGGADGWRVGVYTCVFVERRETNDTITVDVFIEDSAHADQKQLYTRTHIKLSKSLIATTITL